MLIALAVRTADFPEFFVVPEREAVSMVVPGRVRLDTVVLPLDAFEVLPEESDSPVAAVELSQEDSPVPRAKNGRIKSDDLRLMKFSFGNWVI